MAKIEVKQEVKSVIELASQYDNFTLVYADYQWHLFSNETEGYDSYLESNYQTSADTVKNLEKREKYLRTRVNTLQSQISKLDHKKKELKKYTDKYEISTERTVVQKVVE